MNDTILTRTLWYFDDLERRSVRQDILTMSPRSMVVLGEAGMGKSTLLRQLRDRHGYAFTTARSLINLPDGTSRFADAATIVIDALDEVPAQADGDAVDQVIRKLAALGYPRFILSCRVADWRSATAIQGLADLYGEEPLELYLEPLDKLDAVTILEQALGRTNAEATTDTLEEKGLAGLWANPQTLSLVKAVVQAARSADRRSSGWPCQGRGRIRRQRPPSDEGGDFRPRLWPPGPSNGPRPGGLVPALGMARPARRAWISD